MVDLELSTRENWELLLTQRKVAVRYADRILSTSFYEYAPIPPFFANPHSHLLLIGTQSDSAADHWFLGAIASQFLYVSPSLSGKFISGVQVGESVKVGLNRLTLVEFKEYDVFNYVLELKIPTWIQDIYIEVWEYSGFVEPGTREILDRLDSIETKIDAINTP